LESKQFRVRVLLQGLPPGHCHRKFEFLKAPSLKVAITNALDATLESSKDLPRQPISAVMLVESLPRESR
jgi:hypothetical protein